jgi:hypothetical protein
MVRSARGLVQRVVFEPAARGDYWRVGWLAHGPLRNRCPRAAPNPSDLRMTVPFKSLNGPLAPKKRYGGRGTDAL